MCQTHHGSRSEATGGVDGSDEGDEDNDHMMMAATGRLGDLLQSE